MKTKRNKITRILAVDNNGKMLLAINPLYCKTIRKAIEIMDNQSLKKKIEKCKLHIEVDYNAK